MRVWVRPVLQIAQLRGAVCAPTIPTPIIQMNHARDDAGTLGRDLGHISVFLLPLLKV